MRVVFDFCDTLHKEPDTPATKRMRELYLSLAKTGAELYVATATKAPESGWARVKRRRIEMLVELGLPAPIDLAVCGADGKREIFERWKPDLVIDDSKTVVNLAVSMGIPALRLNWTDS